eukprot:TRINITY_DN5817_c0_g1_i16.p1 TRINITY_DN5817_c0_g1~~TRINITY_DN5817_c0_g1_i16.p1  ORF type:complete len:396 (+),score=34.50 TRINITY_DN5817_c0_g1_i16:66-1253(+)
MCIRDRRYTVQIKIPLIIQNVSHYDCFKGSPQSCRSRIEAIYQSSSCSDYQEKCPSSDAGVEWIYSARQGILSQHAIRSPHQVPQELKKAISVRINSSCIDRVAILHAQQIRESRDLQQRMGIAKQEFDQWTNYVEHRKTELPEKLQLTDAMINRLKEMWKLLKDRDQTDLRADKLIDVHNEYSKMFKMDIPLDPRCLLQLIHPHYGYLSYLPGYVKFDDLINIHRIKLVATLERSLGQDILANEIASYAYWQYMDKKKAGYMNAQDFSELLKVFRIAVKPNIADIKREFNFSLQYLGGEFVRDIEETKDIVRFDLFRHIFLERNLQTFFTEPQCVFVYCFHLTAQHVFSHKSIQSMQFTAHHSLTIRISCLHRNIYRSTKLHLSALNKICDLTL